MSPELAGEFAISAIELLICNDISSDNIMMKALLAPSKAINQKNKDKHDQKIENARNKKKMDQKLELIAELYQKGYNQNQIAERIGTTQQTVSNRLILIHSEYPELLQANDTNLQTKSTNISQNSCENTSKMLVQDCTNIVQTKKDCTTGKSGKNCEVNEISKTNVKKSVEKPYFDF